MALSGESRMSVLTAIRAIEVALLSAGLVYTAVMIRGSFSTASSYVFLQVSSFKKPAVSIFRTWLSSPLLICIFMNLIVILIAVSSNLSKSNAGDEGNHRYGLQRAATPPPVRKNEATITSKKGRLARGNDMKKELETAINIAAELGGSDHEEINMAQKPKEERSADHHHYDDTMEATWMAINGRTKPPAKQLKRSETPYDHFTGNKETRKSRTFNDTVTIIRCRGGLRRDPTMNLEELTQRVEAFIQNFNHEMRLQRQESDQRYLDMISQR